MPLNAKFSYSFPELANRPEERLESLSASELSFQDKVYIGFLHFLCEFNMRTLECYEAGRHLANSLVQSTKDPKMQLGRKHILSKNSMSHGNMQKLLLQYSGGFLQRVVTLKTKRARPTLGKKQLSKAHLNPMLGCKQS